MNRYNAAIGNYFGTPYVEMEIDSLGDYISVDDIRKWIRDQRTNPSESLSEALNNLVGEINED